MATLVSEGWIAGRELDPYSHFQQNNRSRLTPAARTQPRTAASWLPSQNNVATGGTGANNLATNTNNSGNARRRNNAPRATQNNASQQNAATSPAGQSQPQGRNRNRNRNRNGNRDAQQGSSDSPNSQPGPGRGRGRGQNNRGGQRSNQPNTEDLTTDPNTGEPISKRAAKRRRAKARKAAREATGGQNNGQQPRNQPQPSTSRLGAVVNQPHASSATQVPNAGATSNARPAASVTSVPPTTRYPSAVHPSPQAQRTVTTATRPTGPDITPVANTNNGATQSTSANSETNNRDSLRDDTLRRWNNFLDPDASRTVRPTNPATSSNNPLPTRLGVVRQAAAAPLAPLQPRRVAPAAPAVRPLVPVVRPPALVRLDALWTSDGEDDLPARVQPARHAREAATPVRPPAINAISRPVTISAVRPLVPVVRPARLGALGSSDEEDDLPRRAQPVRHVRETAARITIPAIAPAPRAVTIPAVRPLVPAVRPPAPARPGALLALDDADDLPRRVQPTRQVRAAAVPLRANAIRPAAPLPPVSVSARPARPAFLRARPTTACLICLDVPDEFPRNRPTTRCAHPITICAPCLEQHISHAVLSQGLTVITCPDASCRQNMEYSDVIRGTKNAKVCQDRYEALLLRRTLEAEPNFVWCKGANCNWGQVHESGANAPIVICQVCRARSCFTHNVPWHTGLTCAQYSAQHAHRDRENAASEAYISRHAKQCPNPRCGRRIEKNDGCDHMTCRLPAGCGHEFCWVCMADYRPILRDGNHLHNPTCRYYAAIQRAPALGDILRGQDVPPPRPVYPGWARPAPVPVTPQPLRPPQPARPAQPEAPATGSFLGWVIGAVIAAFVVTR